MRTVDRGVALVGALIGLAACGEPSGPVLEGQWGGKQLEVVADRRGAEIRPVCGVARLREPLVLSPEGEVDVRAVVDAVSWSQRIRFQATLAGDRLIVRLTWANASGDHAEDHELLRGTAPDYSGIVCPA
jgi:hypothetical protein